MGRRVVERKINKGGNLGKDNVFRVEEKKGKVLDNGRELTEWASPYQDKELEKEWFLYTQT